MKNTKTLSRKLFRNSLDKVKHRIGKRTYVPLELTRKRALHARMSHSTVCNTTVSTKKTRRTLMK